MNGQYQSGDPDEDPRDPLDVWITIWRVIRKPENTATVNAIATLCLCGITIFYTVFSGFQWKATRDATQGATDAFIVSERALLVPMNPNIDLALKAVVFSAVNIGHLPSASGRIRFFEMTVDRGEETKYTVGFPIGNKIEGHWSEQSVPDVTYATPALISSPMPAFDQNDFAQRKIGVLAAGDFSYRDGFQDTPVHVSPFCSVIFYDAQRKATNSVSCDPQSMVEKIKRELAFPTTESSLHKTLPLTPTCLHWQPMPRLVQKVGAGIKLMTK